MKRSRSFWLYGLFLLVLLVVTAEAGLRLKGTYKTYSERNHGRYYSEAGKRVDRYLTHEPGQVFTRKQREFAYEYRINSLGFRERELPVSAGDSIRLFVFGDSFVEGVGAHQDSTWPRALERLLAADYPGATVYACGTSGSDVFFNYINLKERLLAYKPTHVLFAVNSSDVNDFNARGGLERFELAGEWVRYPRGPWFGGLFKYSHLVRYYFVGLRGYGYDLSPPGAQAGREQRAIAAIDDCLERAAALCAQNDLGFLAVTHPAGLELCPGSPDFEPVIKRLDAGLKGKYDRILLTPSMARELYGDRCADYAWPIDGHYNGRGYELLAQHVYDQIWREYPSYFD